MDYATPGDHSERDDETIAASIELAELLRTIRARVEGEGMGKDRSAIDISKFRQLESNINEDFEREGAETPAKVVLFGNGFRFAAPDDRKEQFTQKCMTNAKRLGTALIRTVDLYRVTTYVLDHPHDEDFKAA